MGRNILITGVSQGLGLATAAAVLEAGDAVYGVSRRLSTEFESLQTKHSGRVHFQGCDLGRPAEVTRKIFESFVPLGVALHGLVSNAAVAYDDLVTNLQLEPLEMLFAVNVFSPMMLVKNGIRNMLYNNTAGAIVHVSSVSVRTGYKGLAMYAATKGAMEAFSKNTAREWGERGIRSNCVVAGFMETSMSASLAAETKDRIYRRTALRQATSISSVANTIVYLLSDKAISVTGQNFIVDAGTI